MDKKQRIIISLRKAQTSIESILRRVEEGAPECFPIIQQNLAVIGLLKSANIIMLEQHLEREAGKFPEEQAQRLRSIQGELLRIVKTAQDK